MDAHVLLRTCKDNGDATTHQKVRFGLSIMGLRASPAELSMWSCQKKFVASKFGYLLFGNPADKTESGTSNRWGTTNSKSLEAIIMMSQSETLRSSQIIFITLLDIAAPFTSHSKIV
jgi:hypothetical protein